MKQDVQELITALAHSFCEGLSLEESEVLGMLLYSIGKAMLDLITQNTLKN